MKRESCNEDQRVMVWTAMATVIIIATMLISRNVLLQQCIKMWVNDTLGMEVSIDTLDIGLLQSTITIEGITIYNPAGFQEKVFAKVPLVYIDCDLGPMLRYTFCCSEVEIDVKEISVVTDEDGVVNLNHLQGATVLGNMPSEKTSDEVRMGQAIEVKIDKLILSLYQITITDYSHVGKGRERRMRINIDRIVYNNINSIQFYN